MLNREQVQAELKKLENKQWMEIRVASLARLPEALRGTARTILGQDQTPALFNAAAQAQFGWKILESFAGMDEDARHQVLTLCSPVSLRPWNAPGNCSIGCRTNPIGGANRSAHRNNPGPC